LLGDHYGLNETASELQGVNPREGLPKIRKDWVQKREERGDKVFTQMHYARQGVITEEMAFCAARERLEPEFVRSEVTDLALTISSTAEHIACIILVLLILLMLFVT